MEVSLQEVSRQFGRQRVLSIAESRFPSGAWIGLRGANGAGKSTLLHILAGLDGNHSGRVLYDGVKFSPGVASHVTCVFQEPLLLRRRVRENVELPLRLRGMGARERDRKVDEVLDRMGLGPWSRHEPQGLSRGWRQRVAIARALVFSPRLLLLDEALAPLDADARSLVCACVSEWQRRATLTVISVSHAEACWETPDLEVVLDGGDLLRKEDYLARCQERPEVMHGCG